MDQPMTKLRFLEVLLAERERWDALLSEVGEGRMTEPTLVGSDLWNLDQDERNRIVYEENRDRPLGDVLTEAREVYRDFLECVKHLDDDDLHDPGRYLGMPPDWT